LSCKGSCFTASISFVHHVLAHLCTLKPAVGEEEALAEIQGVIRKYAEQSHRAKDLGLLDGTSGTYGKDTDDHRNSTKETAAADS